MKDLQKFIPLGGLNKDDDPLFIGEGNYTDAKNVRHIADNLETQQSYIPIKGNKIAFNMNPVTAQAKTFRVFHSIGVASRTLTFYVTSGAVRFAATYSDGATFDITSTNMQTAITAAAAVGFLSCTFTYSHTAGLDYTDFFMDSAVGYDYEIAFTNNPEPIIIIGEAISSDLAGALIPIGSYDLLGDLFIFSTPQNNAPTTIAATIISIVSAAGVMRLTTDVPHGIATGQEIVISGANPASNANGRWIALAFSATELQLKFSPVWAANSTTGNIEIYPEGLGEIGVAQYDASADLWSYTRLLRSKEFNFITPKQIKSFGEKTNLTNNIYWVDDYNPTRVFYYNGAYITDGGLNYINPLGRYAYGSIGSETKLLQSTSGTHLTFTDQTQAGGQLKAGNWRYAVRFLTDSLSGTEWTDLSNPVNVYFESFTGTASLISGDDSSTVTGKINELTVTGIVPGLFSFVELAAVWYADNSIIGYVVRRESLNGDQTSIELQHSGTETNVTNLDVGTLNLRSVPYDTAQNIDAIDNRLILSNLTSRRIADLTTWASAFKHQLKVKQISSVGLDLSGPYRAGEYQDPQNVFSFIGYMPQETYRYAVKGRFKDTGELTPMFWVDDIVFNTSATNVQIGGYTPSPNRRVAGLPNYDMTPSVASGNTGNFVNIFYVEFTNINLDFVADGVSIRDLFSEIIFERAECVKEVLAAGCSALTVGNGIVLSTQYGPASGSQYGEYPFISGRLDSAPGASPSYPSTWTAKRDIAKIYSPDIFCSYSNFSFEPAAADKLYNYGQPEGTGPEPANIYKDGIRIDYSSAHEYNGFLNGVNPTLHTVVDMKSIGGGVEGISITGTVSGTITYDNALRSDLPAPDGTVAWLNKNGYLMGLNTNLLVKTAAMDYGFYYTQYFREIPYVDLDHNKYGQRIDTKYIPTGASYTITGTSISLTDTVDVYGGDTFTQKFFLKHRGPLLSQDGGGGGVIYYAQNRVNSQMIQKYDNTGNEAWVSPRNIPATWLQDINLGTDLAPYNAGYTPKNGINSDLAFDNTIPEQTDYGTRIIYSEIKPNNSATDFYRLFLPLNFKDLDPSFGKITHHANGNGELLTWQQRSFQRQYFNQRGTMDVSDGTQVLIGNGSVFGQDGQTLSVIGCKHVWGVIKGKSSKGNDTFYWINTELKKCIRFGYDGTVSIADLTGMQSYFANNVTWADLYDTPAHGEGIMGVFDDRNAEVVFTVRAQRTEALWDSGTIYLGAGNIVKYVPVGGAAFATFEKTGEFFTNNFAGNIGHIPIAYPVPMEILTIIGTTVLTITTAVPHLLITGDNVKLSGIDGMSNNINGTLWPITLVGASSFTITVPVLVNNYVASSGVVLSVTAKYWDVIPHTDNNYYNEWTLVFSEMKNKFTAFYTPLPKIYLKWADTYLAPRPVLNSTTMRVYQFNKGLYMDWWFDGTTRQQENGYMEFVINKNPDNTKWFEALRVDTEITPNRFDFATKNQVSFLTEGEINTVEDYSESSIKEDSTTTFVNDADTSLLYGKWLKVKMTFAKLTYQKLTNAIVKFRLSARLSNK